MERLQCIFWKSLLLLVLFPLQYQVILHSTLNKSEKSSLVMLPCTCYVMIVTEFLWFHYHSSLEDLVSADFTNFSEKCSYRGQIRNTLILHFFSFCLFLDSCGCTMSWCIELELIGLFLVCKYFNHVNLVLITCIFLMYMKDLSHSILLQKSVLQSYSCSFFIALFFLSPRSSLYIAWYLAHQLLCLPFNLI